MIQSQKQYYTIFNKYRNYDFLTTTLAMIGLSIAIINYELEISSFTTYLDVKKYPDPMDHPRNGL